MKIFLNKSWSTVSTLHTKKEQVGRVDAMEDGCTMFTTICFKMIEESRLKVNYPTQLPIQQDAPQLIWEDPLKLKAISKLLDTVAQP